jgi:predicted GNAT family acetyltransferase
LVALCSHPSSFLGFSFRPLQPLGLNFLASSFSASHDVIVAPSAASKQPILRPLIASELPKKVAHVPEHKNFELRVDDREKAWLDYRITLTESGATVLELIHTDVPKAYAGQGIGGALIQRAFEYAKEQRMLVRPTDPQVGSWALRHAEVASLLEPAKQYNF